MSKREKKESFYVLKKYACFNVQNFMNLSFVPLRYPFKETENICSQIFILFSRSFYEILRIGYFKT